MEHQLTTSSSVALPEELHHRVVWWVLLLGNRQLVAGGIAVGFAVVVRSLIGVGFLDVGADSKAATVFASGLTAGVVTLVTVALSINQLILSRVFDAPDSLIDRLEGTRELRGSVEELAGAPASPNDPAAFLSMIAATLEDRAASLEAAIERSAWEPPEDVTAAIHDIREYGTNVDDHVEAQASIIDVLDALLGRGYARNMTATRHILKAYRDPMSNEALEELRAIEELFESIAVARQFFKTLALQQDFAQLSRLVVYTGLLALATTISLTLLYRGSSTTVPPSLLPLVISVGVGVIVTPLAVFTAYVLRAATVGRRTVSTGAFIPVRSR